MTDESDYRTAVLSEMHIWSIVDAAVTMVATTIPVLRVLVRDEYRTRFSNGAGSKRYPNGITRRSSSAMDFICRDKLMESEEGWSSNGEFRNTGMGPASARRIITNR